MSQTLREKRALRLVGELRRAEGFDTSDAMREERKAIRELRTAIILLVLLFTLAAVVMA